MFTEKYAGLTSGLKTNLVSWYDLGSDGLGSELLTNGTFDSDVSGWTAESGGSSVAWNSGQMDIVRSGSSSAGKKTATQLVTGLEVGALYKLSCDVTARNYGVGIELAQSATGSASDSPVAGSGNVTSTGVGILWAYVKATATSEYVCIGAKNNEPATATVDNISIKKVDNDSHGTNDGSIVGATVNTGYTSSPHGVVEF